MSAATSLLVSTLAVNYIPVEDATMKMQIGMVVGELIRSVPLPKMNIPFLDRWSNNSLVIKQRKIMARSILFLTRSKSMLSVHL